MTTLIHDEPRTFGNKARIHAAAHQYPLCPARSTSCCQYPHSCTCLGTELGELGTSGWKDDRLNTKLVHIDSTIEHFTRSMANLHVFGNIDVIFDRLVKSVHEARKWGRRWQTLPDAATENANGGFFTLNDAEKCHKNYPSYF